MLRLGSTEGRVNDLVRSVDLMISKHRPPPISGEKPRDEKPAPPVGVTGEPCDTLASEKALLAEIGRLGGEERLKGAENALEAFRVSLAELVKESPKEFGAGDDPESQNRMIFQLINSVRSSYLLRTVETLRHREGYVLVMGRWVHRAAFTFIAFGLLAAAVLPLCAVSLMSTSAWGWVPGVLGLMTAVAIGVWIFTRIRCK
jgi:hypothetical protein